MKANKAIITPLTKEKGCFFQPKLTINQPNDLYEQEADAVAERVINPWLNSNAFFSPSIVVSRVQRKCEHCEEEEKMMRRKENSSEEVLSNTSLDNYVSKLQDSGSSLDDSTKSFFESRFGYDCSNVKINDDNEAASSAKSINALAYTTGKHIVFGANQYRPETHEGKKLLAHELTHVLYHRDGLIRRQPKNPPATVATPAPKEGVPLKQGGFTVQIEYVTITVLPDVYNSRKEQPHGAHTYMNFSPPLVIPNPDYKIDAKTKLISSFVAYPQLKIGLTVETNYGSAINPAGPSDYGFGTRPEDINAKRNTIRFHEGSHGSEFIGYIQKEIKNHPLPKFEGRVGITEKDFLQKDAEYVQKVNRINDMLKAASTFATQIVDCAGTSIDKHNEGRRGYQKVCP